MIQGQRMFMGSAAARHALYIVTAKKTRAAVAHAAAERLREADVVSRRTVGRMIEKAPEEVVPLVTEAAGGADPLGSLLQLSRSLRQEAVELGDLQGCAPRHLVTGMVGRRPLLKRDQVLEEARQNAAFLDELDQAILQLSDRRVFSLISTHVAEHDPQEVLELPLHELALLFEPYTGLGEREMDGGLGLAC